MADSHLGAQLTNDTCMSAASSQIFPFAPPKLAANVTLAGLCSSSPLPVGDTLLHEQARNAPDAVVQLSLDGRWQGTTPWGESHMKTKQPVVYFNKRLRSNCAVEVR
jgi:hypothetical protein